MTGGGGLVIPGSGTVFPVFGAEFSDTKGLELYTQGLYFLNTQVSVKKKKEKRAPLQRLLTKLNIESPLCV